MVSRSKQKGTRLENRAVAVAKKAGIVSRKQPLSGALPEFPEDCVIGQCLVQCKAGYTRGGGGNFSFSRAWLDGVRESAKRTGYSLGAVLIRPDGTTKLTVCVDYNDFLLLIGGGKKGEEHVV